MISMRAAARCRASTLLRPFALEAHLVLDLGAIAVHKGPAAPAHVDAGHVERDGTEARLREEILVVDRDGNAIGLGHIGGVHIESPWSAILENGAQIVLNGLGFELRALGAPHHDEGVREVAVAVHVLEAVAGDDFDGEDANAAQRSAEVAVDRRVAMEKQLVEEGLEPTLLVDTDDDAEPEAAGHKDTGVDHLGCTPACARLERKRDKCAWGEKVGRKIA
mmetsp:Transcript_23216/g.64876  ORF Transcript_23216/g.64876 Transcript_23216/m.64876 type:complete len:221 (-) Transcript_23216:7-669(-)